MARMNMVQALNSAMDVMLERDPRVVILGEDVGFFGGVFRVTDGLQRKYGEHRVLDTPIAEGGIIAAAIGMGVNGLKPVAEIQFADYIYPGFDQVVSELARLRYRSAGEFFAPVTIRTPCGGGIRGGQTHSQSPESVFTHVCGIKVVMPSNPCDAKGLLISSIEDEDPVVFFEPKRIYNGPFDGDPHKPRCRGARTRAARCPRAITACRSAAPHWCARVRKSACSLTAPWCTSPRRRCGLRASTRRSSTCAAWRRSTWTRCAPRSARPAAVWWCTRRRASAAMARSSWPRFRNSASGISKRRCSASPAGTRLIRTRSNGSIFRDRRALPRRSSR